MLLRLAEDPDRHVRERAVQAIGQAGGAATVDALLAMASDPEPRRRIEAAKALGAAVVADFPRAGRPEMLAADAVPEVRAPTISGIASTMKPSPLGEHLVIRLTGDPDPSVRQRVAVLARHLAPTRLESILRHPAAGLTVTRSPPFLRIAPLASAPWSSRDRCGRGWRDCGRLPSADWPWPC